jgi:hypothetical protein
MFSAKQIVLPVSTPKLDSSMMIIDMKADFWLGEMKHAANESYCYFGNSEKMGF